MRRNLYNKNVNIFLKALKNLGWKEVTLDERGLDRDFKKGPFHLILRSRKVGPYCVIHKNCIAFRHHTHPITKGHDLIEIFREIIREYKKLVG